MTATTTAHAASPHQWAWWVAAHLDMGDGTAACTVIRADTASRLCERTDAAGREPMPSSSADSAWSRLGMLASSIFDDLARQRVADRRRRAEQSHRVRAVRRRRRFWRPGYGQRGIRWLAQPMDRIRRRTPPQATQNATTQQ